MKLARHRWVGAALMGAALVSAALACSEGSDQAAGRGATRSVATDSAGVTIVRGPATDDSLPWTFTLLREIGGADSGAQAFDQAAPYNVATDGHTRIAVLDGRRDNRIHLFDADGTLLQSLGGKGGGPGEMEYPQGIALQPSGQLAAVDAAKSALLRWEANGTVLPEVRLNRPDGRVWGMTQLRGDTVYAAVDVLGRDQAVRRLERWTPADTLPLDSTMGPKPAMVRFQCVGLALAPLFTGELTFAVGADLVAVTHQQAYVVNVLRAGRLVRSIRRDVVPTPTVPADAAKLYPEGLVVGFGGGGRCVTPAEEVGKKVGMAPTLPVVRAMAIAPDGHLWVERFTFEGEVPRTDVFAPDGQYVGTAHGRPLPLGFLSDNRVLFPVTDAESGTSRIGIFRSGPVTAGK